MSGRHVSDRLAAFADGQLDSADANQIIAHLAACERCREAFDDHQFAAAHLRDLSPAQAPPHIWTSIEVQVTGPTPAAGGWMGPRRLAYVAAVILIAAVAWWSSATRPQPWDVVRIDSGDRRLAAGEWIETSGGGVARLRIGEIGTVDVAPGSRMQLVSAGPEEHRLHLAHGRISAEIVAPPRIFFVETPASTVVDLGCAYTMEVDQDGVGILRVTGGWAALEWGERESLVPAGASAPTRPELGPGTPVFDDATARLRQALLDFDFGAGDDAALDVVVAEARERDTLTLWHLMSRVEVDQRARVFDRIVALTPLPAGVDRDRVLALDPDAMRHWREELAWTW
jgi:hypothetical protein